VRADQNRRAEEGKKLPHVSPKTGRDVGHPFPALVFTCAGKQILRYAQDDTSR
jgi:hypothetical protein